MEIFNNPYFIIVLIILFSGGAIYGFYELYENFKAEDFEVHNLNTVIENLELKRKVESKGGDIGVSPLENDIKLVSSLSSSSPFLETSTVKPVKIGRKRAQRSKTARNRKSERGINPAYSGGEGLLRSKPIFAAEPAYAFEGLKKVSSHLFINERGVWLSYINLANNANMMKFLSNHQAFKKAILEYNKRNNSSLDIHNFLGKIDGKTEIEIKSDRIDILSIIEQFDEK